ncbi:CBS-HotDog domain-containing transcription factor SpxR [Streptococcus ratti]|uniref:CBS domain-containing protein n=1 Tax=Streptococcus ratti TaxID=1341 RepID=A0A7X9LG32_STRRT|nr:CBS-HotDog domain-containing transcription factor SpxR [Streptococcus ratti]NMD49220.1 CBS domain-containing protein [Streptococcus ratti]
MSKHQDILEYLENLAIGKRVSVRSISNHLKVSDGTAYRAIKEAENRGIVETRPRSGTIRVEKKVRVRLNKLTYKEIANISESEVVSGQSGLSHEFSKFSIGAMTIDNIHRYLTKDGLLIVGDRENIQLLALQNKNAILVTGGFPVSERVRETSNQLGIPVMISNYDTFTVATLINQALSNVRIKTDIKTVEEVYEEKIYHGFLHDTDTVKDYNNLIKKTNHVRYPVINSHNMVVGVISMRDVAGKDPNVILNQLMTKNPVVAKPTLSLANISQKMIFEDYDMLPVVKEDYSLLGVITRRQVMENLQNFQRTSTYTYSEQITANLQEEKNGFQFVVEPTMIDPAGNLAHGVLTEFLKDITMRVLTQKHKKNIIIEQMMLYFLQAVQIDDLLKIQPKVITENRRSATLDFEIYHGSQVVTKAVVTTKLN